MPISPRFPRVAAMVCVVTASSAASALAACPSSEPASAVRITNEINAARASNGLTSLRPLARITAPASTHSTDMAVQRRLWHDDIRRWAHNKSAAQNVGYGLTSDIVFRTMWNSPPHRRAILTGRYRRVGVSAVRSCNGDLMVTVNFLS